LIQLHRLEGFYWVARVGGYARAARAFPYPITQPAVHQQVKKLETELGLTLFERVGKDRMILTAAGERLFRFVRPYFEGLPGVLRSLTSNEVSGELRVAAASMFLRKLLPPWVRRLKKRYPEVDVHLTEALEPAVDPLLNGEVDAAVDHFPNLPSSIASQTVGIMRPYVVLPAKHPAAARKRLRLSDLEQETFVAYSPGLLPHAQQFEALALHELAPARRITATTADVILGFVEAGLGFSILPSLEPEAPKSRNLKFFPLPSPKVEFPVQLAWRKDTPENPLLDALLESAPEVAKA
jgi:LysR family transcriptional regulator, benzoate and cis,cis-muconate-responsive activator of ben and cat genes